MAQLQNTIEFNISNPFPFLEPDSYTYEAAKRHSEKVDHWLGIPLEENSGEASQHQTWQHLSSQQFQTPYCEIRNILHELNLKPGQTLVDLGCGYGRIGFVMGEHFKKNQFLGFEVVNHRVQKAQEIIAQRNWQNLQVLQQDITSTDFQIPKADTFFIFDFGYNNEIQNILLKLKEVATQKPIQVVGRGRATRHFIQTKHPWLSQVIDPQHRAHYSIYKS